VKAARVLLLATLTAACALTGGGASANSGSASGITQTSSWDCPTGATAVDMRTGFFDPTTIDVSTGTTVCWSNQDGWTHTVTSDTGAFDSGVIGLAQTYSFTFNTAGSYAYHDALYPCMTGTVNVGSGPPPEPLPPPPCQPRPPPGCPTDATFVDILHGFTPATVYVVPGTTVCWWNRDGWSHTVTSDTRAFDSGDIGTGFSYSFTFNTTGSYGYHDALYPDRTGTVNVDTKPPPPAGSFIVPRVIGLKLAIARSRIRRSKGSVGRVRRARSSRVGRVIAQAPAPGKRLAMGARVSLVVGRR
jgi:plastocyanin